MFNQYVCCVIAQSCARSGKKYLVILSKYCRISDLIPQEVAGSKQPMGESLPVRLQEAKE